MGEIASRLRQSLLDRRQSRGALGRDIRPFAHATREIDHAARDHCADVADLFFIGTAR